MSGSGVVVPGAPLFASARFAARELVEADVPGLQALFDANPGYFVTVNGRQPGPDAARIEFDDRPPPHLPWTRRWFLGLFDGAGAMVGVADVVSDLSAPGVWHLALFLVATPLHGTGAAQELYAALEGWIAGSGACWLRLGVVRGNARAERFWEGRGFRETRVRRGVDTGGRVNDVRVMVKALAGGTLADYRDRVARDRPDSPLP
jgi:GNAT superfamily N-acetyltransferase